MSTDIYQEAALRVLACLYADGDHVLTSFLYGAPGAPHWERRFGTEIFVRDAAYVKAILFIRANGAPYLRDISMSKLRSMTTNFITEHYAYISGGKLILKSGLPFSEQISPEGFVALTGALQRSSLFSPRSEVSLYPLVPIRVAEGFHSKHLFFTNSDGLATALASHGMSISDLRSGQFPPLARMNLRATLTTDWLGVSSPDQLISRKMAFAALGALSLTSIRRERYTHTGRDMHGGYCTITQDNAVVSPSKEPLTPPLSSDIHLTRADHDWLQILSSLFDNSDLTSRSRLRALEYFYRAWFADPRERFPTLCMSLDSVVGATYRHTIEAIQFIGKTIAKPLDEKRLRLLMRLRGAVIHGAAPDVYESEHYETYYSDYGADPIVDLELIVAKCLRETIFSDALKVHPDPHADIIRDQQAKRRLPPSLRGRSIIEDD